jgi:Carboxypeptidase regulatory-like domain
MPRIPLQSLCSVLLLVTVVAGHSAAAQARPVRPDTATTVRATSTITGTILDEGGIPVEGAQVSLPDGKATTVSGEGGAFRLTGVPAGKATVEVRKEGFGTLVFDFDIAAGVTVAVKLSLLSIPPPLSSGEPEPETSPADATANGRTSIIAGTVTDSARRPLFGVTIEAASSNIKTMTDSAGRFRMLGIEPGLNFVRARKVGFLPEYFPVTTVAGRTTTASINLRPAGQQLAGVEVRADGMQRNSKMRGFYERAAAGTGIFVEREEIVRRNASQVSEILRGRNGINVYGQGANGALIAGRTIRMAGGQGGAGVCPLALILDGVNVPLRDGLTIDRVVNVQDVRGIEVYTTGPQVPAELANGATECGAVVVWTR